jgi:hypothetical protein
MAITEYQGVIINKLTLAQYKSLKASNQLESNQTYVITDLDNYLDLDYDTFKQITVSEQIKLSLGTHKLFIYSNGISAPSSGLWIDENGEGYFTKLCVGANGVYKDVALQEYWQVREGVVIPVDGLLFYNPNTVDVSSIPLDTTLVTLVGQNGITTNMKLVYSNGQYQFNAEVVGYSSVQTLATGTSLSAMNFTNEYMRVLSSSYGYFVKVAYIHPNVLNIIDSIIKINNTNF